MILKSVCFLLSSLLMICFFSCRNTHAPTVSFYYWKTAFAPDQQSLATLKANHVQQLYVRYFDIEFDKHLEKAQPVGVIQFSNKKVEQTIVPVIYIKNEVFTQISFAAIDTLCNNVLQLTNQINDAIRQQPTETQFDCDWTLNSKDRYFQFLKRYKAISRQKISATIRLHQVKHVLTTGVPPVDKGVLMFYNMGTIDASNKSSIYDESIAASYLDKLNKYMLPLDVALPVFSWGIQIRDGHVVHLLNKMNAGHFENDSCFKLIRKGRYGVTKSCFKGGYYFLQNDEVKIEAVTTADLKSMATLINDHSNHNVQQIIFYDLDAFNLKNYETNTYRQTADFFN